MFPEFSPCLTLAVSLSLSHCHSLEAKFEIGPRSETQFSSCRCRCCLPERPEPKDPKEPNPKTTKERHRRHQLPEPKKEPKKSPEDNDEPNPTAAWPGQGLDTE